MPTIFDYTDYRAFLRDRMEELRNSTSVLSYRYLGAKVGMDASQVVKILQGQLHLSERRIPGFIRFLKLDEREAEYFRLLVGFNKAKRPEQARLYFDRMVALSGAPTLKLERDQYIFFSQWYYAAVWCALEVHDCKDDYADLGAFLTPPIPVDQAEEAIRLLERLHLVERNADGFWKSTQQNLSTGKSWQSMAVRLYQREMIRLGGEAIERFSKEERDISTLTLNVGTHVLEELRVATEEYRRTLVKLSNQSESTDRVYQLNIQLFPITRASDRKVS